MADISSFFYKFNVVKQIPVFSRLNWYELQKIARKTSFSYFKKGEIVKCEGDPPDCFYCVISGRLQAYTTSHEGLKENIDFIHRGMYFGIISLFTGENHSMTFEALNDSVILKIQKNDFLAILKSITKLAVEFSQELSKRVRRNVKRGKGIFHSKIISIYSPVKGTGSSTYALNLALSLKKQVQKNIIFVNIHSQKNPEEDNKIFNLNENLSNYFKINECVMKDKLNIDLLNVTFALNDQESLSENVLKNKIAPLVTSLVGDYHYVVVGLPNEMDDIVFETLTQSDLIHLISRDEENDIHQLRRVIDKLEINLKENFKEDKIKVIISTLNEDKYVSYEEINKTIDYNVYAILPSMEEEDKKEEFILNLKKFSICGEKSKYQKIITRISREIGNVMIGLALGGGAALGLAHIGVLRVLEEENIPIDIISGSSMGALIGSFWAAGKSAEEIEKLGRSFRNKQNLIKLLDPVFPISGVIGGHAIKKWLQHHLGDVTFYNTRIPIRIVAYDLLRRQDLIISQGSLVEAVRKSIAIPGIIEPIKKRDQLIIDGGVLNPLPTNVLTSMGIKKIISVNVLQSPEDVLRCFERNQQRLKEKEKIKFLNSPISFIKCRISKFFKKYFSNTITDIIVMTLQASEYVIAQQSAGLADVNIHPNLSSIDWYEIYKVDELINEGEKAARAVLPQIKKLVEEI